MEAHASMIDSRNSGSVKQPSEIVTGQQGFFDPFSEQLKAYSDFVQAVAQHKLADAQEQLIRAQADGQEARAAILWTVTSQLETDLYRWNMSAQSMERIYKHAQRK
jgi:hypothetical protein